MAAIIKDLHSSSSLLPARVAGESFSRAAERDQSSAAAQLAKIFYITPHLLFCAFTFVILFLGSLCLGPSYQTFVALSVGASTVTIACVGAWIYWVTRNGNGKDDWRSLCAGTAGLLAAAVPFYAQLFSPWGAHNFGVLGLSSAGFLTTRALMNRSGWKTSAVVLAAFGQFLAFYSHWTCLLLLPPATVGAILTTTELNMKCRLAVVAKYSLFVLLCAGPVLLLMVLIHSTPASSGIVYAGLQAPGAEGFNQVSHRFMLWFAAYSSYFSLPGLLAGLWGLGVLAVEDRIVLPILTAIGHLTLWTFMPGFTWNGSPTELRTLNYLLPIFAVGVTWTLARLFVHRRASNNMYIAINTVFVVLAVVHVALQLKADVRLNAVSKELSQFTTTYTQGQGLLRFMSRDIDKRLPENATLIAGNSEIRDLYDVLTSRSKVQFAPGLDSFLTHYNNRDLKLWIGRRNLSVNCSSVFVLASADSGNTLLEQAVGGALGPGGFGCAKSIRLEKVHEYETETTMEKLALYQVIDLN